MNKSGNRNKKKFGIVLLFFAVFAILVLGILMYKNPTSKDQTVPKSPTPGETVNPSAIVSAVACKTAEIDSSLYTNKTYGFALNVPPAWTGYKIDESADKSGVVGQIKIQLDSTSGTVAPLTIYVYKIADWDGIDQNSRSATEITRNNTYVFAYSTWEQTPPDLPRVTDKDLVNIIDSFKLIK